MKSLAADPKRPFFHEGPPKSATHERLRGQFARFETDSDLFTLDSFRQEGQPSLQAVVAIPPSTGPARPYYADLDIDLGNPLQDLAGFFVHMGELLGPGKTDHLDLRMKLAKGRAKAFLYYRATTI